MITPNRPPRYKYQGASFQASIFPFLIFSKIKMINIRAADRWAINEDSKMPIFFPNMEFMEPCRAMVKPARAAIARYNKEYPAKATPPQLSYTYIFRRNIPNYALTG